MIYRFDYADCRYEADLSVTYTPGRPATGPSMSNAGGDPAEPAEVELEINKLLAIENGERILLTPPELWPEHLFLEEYLMGDGMDGVLEKFREDSEPDYDAINDARRDR